MESQEEKRRKRKGILRNNDRKFSNLMKDINVQIQEG